MAKDEEQIKKEIEAHMAACGGAPAEWYVGISSDARQRLLVEHKVDERTDPWIYSMASSAAAARSVERYFVEKRQTAGGPGGGDETARMVYAYKRSDHTEP